MRWKSTKRAVLSSVICVLVGLAVAVTFYLRLPWIRTETVRFQVGDVTLVGTLALPRWRAGPYPAAVIVHGSGGLSRWLHWVDVKELVPHGMAVLIYDKRGVGDSTGTNPQELIGTVNFRDIGNPNAPPFRFNVAACGQMLDILAGDALAGVEWLKTRQDIDPRRIGFVGISQAGWVMPLAASRSRDVAFIVNVSAPAVTCGLQMRYTELTGVTPGFRNLKLSDQETDRRLREYEGPVGYDPVPVLESLRVPTLWVFGGRDEMVPTSWSVAVLKRIIAERGAPFELRVYPDSDHSLRRDGSDWQHIDYWHDVRPWLAARGMLPPT